MTDAEIERHLSTLATASAQAIALAMLAMAKQLDVQRLQEDMRSLLVTAESTGKMLPLTQTMAQTALSAFERLHPGPAPRRH